MTIWPYHFFSTLQPDRQSDPIIIVIKCSLERYLVPSVKYYIILHRQHEIKQKPENHIHWQFTVYIQHKHKHYAQMVLRQSVDLRECLNCQQTKDIWK